MTSTISLATTVFAQAVEDGSKNARTKKEQIPETVRTEIRNFHERMKAIKEECRKKREELMASLSRSAQEEIQNNRRRSTDNDVDMSEPPSNQGDPGPRPKAGGPDSSALSPPPPDGAKPSSDGNSQPEQGLPTLGNNTMPRRSW